MENWRIVKFRFISLSDEKTKECVWVWWWEGIRNNVRWTYVENLSQENVYRK